MDQSTFDSPLDVTPMDYRNTIFLWNLDPSDPFAPLPNDKEADHYVTLDVLSPNDSLYDCDEKYLDITGEVE